MKLTDRQRQALMMSIEHWSKMRNYHPQQIIAANDYLEDRGAVPVESPIARDCECCRNWRFPACEGCPIAEATEDINCYGTPYSDAYEAFRAIGRHESAECLNSAMEKWKNEADKMIEFMVEILKNAELQ